MIRFRQVTKSYSKRAAPALDHVSLVVDQGEFAFLTGPSGSGKSTILKLLLAEEKPSKGEVFVGKVKVNSLSSRRIPALRRNFGVVYQDFRLLPARTVRENVQFALEVLGFPRSQQGERVDEALELVGMEDKGKRWPHELSGGEQQRVAIARAIVNEPTIVLADEPTGNLDPSTSEDILQVLDRVNRTGTTVLMATHDYRMVDSLRARVIEMGRGAIVRDDDFGGYGAEG